MTQQTRVTEMVAGMSESEAKRLLSQIFLTLDRIDNDVYSKEKALEEIRNNFCALDMLHGDFR